MGRLTDAIVDGCRFLGLLGAILAAGGAFGLAVGLLEGLERQGFPLPIRIPVTGAEAEALILGGFSAVVVGASLRLVASSVANFLTGFRTGTEEATKGGAPTVPAAERYCRRLETMYLVNGGFIAVIAAIAVVGTVALGLVGRLAVVLVTALFGGVLVAVSLLGIWYGITKRATEALAGGFAFAVVFLLLGLVTVRLGFLVFAILLAYYSVFARGATEFRYVDPAVVPAALRARLE